MLAHKAEEGGEEGSHKPLRNHLGNEEAGLIRNQTSAAGDGGPSRNIYAFWKIQGWGI